ncbi:glutathione S-transferase [Temperatibacter marinus]|uniref:Glutathione S-transferase n=1 Tax=Temperatibacter marinus TaxID=1456591 RepID=A0AA52HBU0_9PROT|nr:glutathione S-transferase [Temperatibacter marinus]WND03998.1 glutathione S-transferase [Temperatibacter marinus]
MTPFKIVIGNKNYSSWSFRGWLALEVLEVEFEEILLPLDTPEFFEKIKGLNPSGTVPAVWHGDTLVWDSLAIIDYLDKVFPDYGYWPTSPEAYAWARGMSAEMHSGLFGLRAHCPMNMREHFKGLSLADHVQKNVDRIEYLWTQALEKFSGAGPYLFGNKLTGADIMFAPVVSRFRTYDIKLNERCEAYRKAIESSDAYSKWYKAGIQESWIVDQDEIDRAVKILGAE